MDTEDFKTKIRELKRTRKLNDEIIEAKKVIDDKPKATWSRTDINFGRCLNEFQVKVGVEDIESDLDGFQMAIGITHPSNKEVYKDLLIASYKVLENNKEKPKETILVKDNEFIPAKHVIVTVNEKDQIIRLYNKKADDDHLIGSYRGKDSKLYFLFLYFLMIKSEGYSCSYKKIVDDLDIKEKDFYYERNRTLKNDCGIKGMFSRKKGILTCVVKGIRRSGFQ